MDEMGGHADARQEKVKVNKTRLTVAKKSGYSPKRASR
jgi:hypothetical protein